MKSPNSAPSLLISGTPLINPYFGVGMYTLRLIRGLARSNQVAFKVLLPAEAEESLALLPPGCAQIVPGGRGLPIPSIGRDIYWMGEISRIALREHPQAVLHSPGPFWSRRRPKKVAVTLHDCIYRRYPFYLGRFPFRKWMASATERFAAKSDLVLTVSQCSARDLAQLAAISPEKIKVIQPWIEDRFNPAFAAEEADRVRAKYQLPPSYFLYLGGYDFRKNVEFLIRAYAEAKTKKAMPPLVLAGRIPAHLDRTLCDVHGAIRDAGLSVPADVNLPGLIDDLDMPGLYGGAQVLVYPSIYEGFGLPPMEAMACGRPVLVGDNSSLIELIPSEANRFPTDSPAELIRLLLRIQESESEFLLPLDLKYREEPAIAAYLDIMRSSFDLS